MINFFNKDNSVSTLNEEYPSFIDANKTEIETRIEREIVIPANSFEYKTKRMGTTKVMKDNYDEYGKRLPRQYYDLFYENQWTALYPYEVIDKRVQSAAETMIDLIDPDKVLVVSDLHIGKNNEFPINQIHEITDKINDRLNGFNDSILILLGDIIDCDDIVKHRDLFEMFLNEIDLYRENIILILGNNDILTIDDYNDFGIFGVFTELKTTKFLISHFPSNDIKLINIHGHNHAFGKYLRYPNKNHVDASYTDNNRIGRYRVFTLTELILGVEMYNNFSETVQSLENVQYIYTIEEN